MKAYFLKIGFVGKGISPSRQVKVIGCAEMGAEFRIEIVENTLPRKLLQEKFENRYCFDFACAYGLN